MFNWVLSLPARLILQSLATFGLALALAWFSFYFIFSEVVIITFYKDAISESLQLSHIGSL